MKMFIVLGYIYVYHIYMCACGDDCDGTNKKDLSGVVGGEVVFRCNSGHQHISLFTFQKENPTRVLYASRKSNKTDENVIVNYSERTVTIKNLNCSYEGEYKCLIQDNSNCITKSYLKIAANPSAPTIEYKCASDGDVSNCTLTCTATGVNSSSKITWNVTSGLKDQWKQRDNGAICDEHTLLHNISSIVSFPCSDQLKQNASCSVGKESSNETTVCGGTVPLSRDAKIGIAVGTPVAGVALVALVALVVGGLIYWKRKIICTFLNRKIQRQPTSTKVSAIYKRGNKHPPEEEPSPPNEEPLLPEEQPSPPHEEPTQPEEVPPPAEEASPPPEKSHLHQRNCHLHYGEPLHHPNNLHCGNGGQ